MFAVRVLMIIALALMMSALLACTNKVATTNASMHDVDVAQSDVAATRSEAVDAPKKQGNENVVLQYDAKMDVYVVAGQDDCYYTAGQFYRKVQGAWEWSVCIGGPWKAVEHRNDLPPGLRKHKA